MAFFYRLLLFLIIFICPITQPVLAQTTDNYPVQTTVYFGAPTTPRLSEWFTSDQRLFVLLQLKDLTKPTLPVYLRWQLEGPGIRIATRTGYVPPAFFSLIPGHPSRLSGTDLAAHYFSLNVLETEGLEVQEAYNASLPEGFYTFSVQAFEAATGQVVSNTAQTFLVLSSPQPPVLNLPANGTSLPVSALQKVLFQWTPRHFATPTSQVVYRLKVCRVADQDEPNEQTMLSCTEPVLDKTAAGTSLTGDMTQWIQPLQPGQRYAVQLQAIDLNNQLTNFANQGYSQVQWFRYGQQCLPPSSFTLQSVTSDRVRLRWEAQPQALAYVVDYKAQNATEWTSVKVYGTTYMVSDLQPKTTYVFRLRSDCGGLLPSAPGQEQEWNISQEAPEAAPEWPKALVQPELMSVQTINNEAVVPTTLQELYVNFPVATSPPNGSTSPNAPTGLAPTAVPSSATSTNPPAVTKLKIPDCALRAGSFTDCQPTHPVIPLPTGEELTSLNVGDVLGIYDFAVFVTKVGEGPGFSGEGLVRLPFLGNAMIPMEFKGVRAKKGEEGTNGGCVYTIDTGGYVQSKNNISNAELTDRRHALVRQVVQKSYPTAFVGTLQQALQKYDAVAKEITEATQNGRPLLPEQVQQLIQYTAAILQGSQGILNELQKLEETPALTAVSREWQELIRQLTKQQQALQAGSDGIIIPALELTYRALFDKIKGLTTTPAEPPSTRTPHITNVKVKNATDRSVSLQWTGDTQFVRYDVVYQRTGEGERTQTVTRPLLQLNALRENSYYQLKIIGYGANQNVLDTYGPVLFRTLPTAFPPPQQLAYTILSENSVKITWGKNKQHLSYKVVYREENGEERVAYPTNNQLILSGLKAGQKYSYSIVAYGADNRSSTPVISAFATSVVPLLSADQPTACADESVSLKGICPTGWHVSWTWQQPQGPQTSLATVLTQPGPNTYQAVCIQNATGQIGTARSLVIAPKNPVFCQPVSLSKADNYFLWVNPSDAAAFAQVPRKSASNARTGSNTRGIFNVTMMFGPDDCWEFQVQVEDLPKSPSTTPDVCVPFTIHKPLTDPAPPASGSGNVDVPGTGAYPPISDPLSNTPILNPSDPTAPSNPQTPEIPVLPRPQVPRPSTPCTNEGEDYVWTTNEYGYMGWVCKPINLRNGARTSSPDAVVTSTTPSGSNTPCISFVIGDQEYRVTVLNKEPVPCSSTSEDFEKNLLVAFLEQQYPDIRYYGPPTNDTYLGLRDGFMELFDQALPAIAEGPQRQAQLKLYFKVLQYLVNGITDFSGAQLTLTPDSYSTLYELLTNKGATEGVASALSQLLLQQGVKVEYARGKTDIAALSQYLQEIYTALQDVSPALQAQLWDYVTQHPGTGPLQALARFSVPEDTEPADPKPLPAWVAAVSYFNDLNRLATDGRRSSGNALVRMSDGRELKAYVESATNFVYLFDQQNGVEYFNLNGHWVLRRYEQTEVVKYYDEADKLYRPFTPADGPATTNEILLRYGRGLAKFGYLWNLVVVNTAGSLLGTGALISVEMATAAQLIPLYAATTDLTIIDISRYELEHLNSQTKALYEAYDGVMLYMSLVEMGTAAAATGHYSYISYRQAQEFQVQQQQLAQRLADLRANPAATLSPQQLAEWERLTQRSGQAALDAVNHLESLKGVRTLFGTKGDEMNSGLLEQISQSNFTAEEIAVLTQNLDDYPWLLETLNGKPEQVRAWTVNQAGDVLGSIVKNGNKIEYTNPAGKLLKWSEQSANDITNAINTSKNLPVEANNIGRITEAKVGEFVKGKKNLDSYGIVIKDDVGQVVAELDVTTLDEIIEIKASFSSVKEDQFGRLVNSTEARFVNPYQKKVILYIDKPLSEATQGQINMINRIKGQGVTVVHSLEELGGVLK